MSAIAHHPAQAPVGADIMAPDTPGAAIAAERADLCKLLSSLLHRPLDASQIAALTAPEAVDSLRAGGIDFGVAASQTIDRGLLQHVLATDFTHVFHAAHGSVQPFEGIQTGLTDELMGPAAQAAGSFMASVGFTVATSQCPDSLAVELAFLAELLNRESEALSVSDMLTAGAAEKIRREFFTKHLGRWGRQVARAIGDRAETPFYCSVARVLEDVLDELRQD